MGFFFTLLYLFFSLLTPTEALGQLGQYHIAMIVAILAVITSVPALQDSGILRSPQTWASLALTALVMISLLQTGWLGGVFHSGYTFLTVEAGFFLVAINCRTPRQLQLIVLAILAGSLYFVARASLDLHNQVFPSPFIYGSLESPRIRGLGVVNDPNDLAQVLVSLIPLVFLWRTTSRVVNVFAVGVPVVLLTAGMFLTHSRGSAVALTAVIVFAMRRKIGTVPAVILGAAIFAGALSFGWSGGRDVSMEAGADRLDAWSQGLTFIKTHPLLGIGFGQFAELYYITAHNSVVVCAAETGVPGLFCWVLLLLSSFRMCLKLAKVPDTANATEAASAERVGAAGSRGFLPAMPVPATVGAVPVPPSAGWRRPVAETRAALSPREFWAASRPAPATAGASGFPVPAVAERRAEPAADMPDALTGAAPVAQPVAPVIDRAEVRRIAQLLPIALVGFVAAGWFLSRAYSVWLFTYCGMVCALVRMAHVSGIDIPRDRPGLLLRWSAIVTVGLIVLVYIILRVRNVIGH